MSAQHDKPTSRASTLAAQVHAARVRNAFSVETLAVLAQADHETIKALEKGDDHGSMAVIRSCKVSHRRISPADRFRPNLAVLLVSDVPDSGRD